MHTHGKIFHSIRTILHNTETESKTISRQLCCVDHHRSLAKTTSDTDVERQAPIGGILARDLLAAGTCWVRFSERSYGLADVTSRWVVA